MTTNGTNLFLTEDGITVQKTNMSKEEVQRNILKIMDWIRGPGNKLLISQNRLPLSFEEADEIRKAHEQFEFKCMQALAMYARLRDPRDLAFTAADGLDQMEQSVKLFMQNLQRRRNVVVTCYTFFRLVRELRDLMASTDQLAEMLEAAHDLDSAERCLARLNTTLKTLDTKYGLLARECERVRHLIDQIQVMQAVERSMDELREQLTATTEWLKLRALETKKTLQVLTCERDARQGNEWLAELCGRLVESYHRDCVGKTPVESGDRLEAHKRLETKASEAHDYCKQLAQALMLMYRAAGRRQDAVEEFTAETGDLWRRLTILMRETSERLEVADAFYRNVDILLSRVEQLLILISRDLDGGAPLKQVRQKYGRGRDELLGEFEETKNMGMALMERIGIGMETQAPLEGVESVERTNGVIKMKLYTLWLKIREFLLLLGQKMEITAWIERWEVIRIQIDRLYELMRRLEERWTLVERLPRTLSASEEALAEHRRAWNDVTRLWEQVEKDMGELLSINDPQQAQVKVEAEKEMERMMTAKQQFDRAWKGQQKELEHRHDLLIRLNDLDKEVDMRFNLLNTCKDRCLYEHKAVRESQTQLVHWTQDLPELRRRINEFFSEVRATVGDEFEPHTGRLRDQWERYQLEIELFQWLLEIAELILSYRERVREALRRFNVRVPQCRSAQEVDALLQELAALMAEGRQLVRSKEVLDKARQLYAQEEPVRPLLKVLDDVFVEIATEVEEVSKYKISIGEESITATHSISVRSAPKPRPTVHITASEPKNGGDLEFIVDVEGLDSNPRVSWFKNGRAWSVKPPWRESWDGNRLRVYRSNTGPSDAGRYAVVVEDDSGQRVEASCEARVLQPPSFARQMEEDVTVVEGDPLLLQCQVVGEPEPRGEWYHNGQQVSSRRGDLLIDNGDGVCAIKIPRVSPRHAGVYECWARNRAGDTVARTEVTVQGEEDAASIASRVTLDSDVEPQNEEPVERSKVEIPDRKRSVSEMVQKFDAGVAEDRFVAISRQSQQSRVPSSVPENQKRPWAQHRDYYQSMSSSQSRLFHWDSNRFVERREKTISSPVPMFTPVEIPDRSEKESPVSEVDEPFITPQRLERPKMKQPLGGEDEYLERETLRLTVRFEGTPAPEVIWYKDRLVITEDRRTTISTSDTSSTLTIERLQASDSGLYAVVMKNDAGTERSSSQVTVKKPGYAPTLIRQSSCDQTVNEGGAVTLELILSADPDAEVTWFKGGRVIRPSADFEVVDRSDGVHQLIVKQAYLEDTGEYRAVARNHHGSKEVFFSLHVEPVEVDEEDVVTANTIGAQHAAPPIPVDAEEDEEIMIATDVGAQRSAPPMRRNSRSSDTSNDRKRDSQTMSDEAPTPGPPVVADELEETQTCSAGDRVFLRCRLSGHPPPLVSWYKDDVKLESSDRHQFEVERGISSFDDEFRLVIPDAKAEDSGVYKLIASNVMGTVRNECELKIVGSDSDQKRTTLIFHNTVVKSPPEFTQLFRDEICKTGETVILQCQIIGLPAPTVWWSYNGEMMDQSRCQFESRGERYSLVIPNVKPEDSGRYSVTAENSSGVATCSSLVIVEEHGKTGAIERSTYSRSSSRPLSPLLSIPMPSHSQLSQLAPPMQLERVRTVEVAPRSQGDSDISARLFVERNVTSGSLSGAVLNTRPDLASQLSRPLSPGSIIVASQTTRQETTSSSSIPRPVTIVREYENPPDSPSRSSPDTGRRQFGRGKSSNIPVRIVRELNTTKQASTVMTTTTSRGRYSFVESSEYDSD